MLDTIKSAATTTTSELPSLDAYDLAVNIATELLTGFYLNIDVRDSSAWSDFGAIVNTIARQISRADHDLITLGRERDADR
jgi:hypothetical protein